MNVHRLPEVTAGYGKTTAEIRDLRVQFCITVTFPETPHLNWSCLEAPRPLNRRDRENRVSYRSL